MRPTRLSMHNIRAFESVDLDFRNVTAAALVGKNGAGKSTITEGILRALYSDGPTILPNSLVRLGSDIGSVKLDYEHNGQRYRIIRLGGKRSDLQYLVSDGNGGWNPLTGATSKETQEKINASLAMDEDLFLNSCCVMQGKSAGICTARPAERKAVMYRIYDKELSRFASLHDAAKKRVAAADAELAASRAKCTDLEGKIALKPGYEEAKAKATEALQVLGMELAAADAELAKLREQAARIKADQEKLEALNRQVEDLDREMNVLRERIEVSDRAIRECDELLSSAEEIKAQCQQADKLEADLQQMQSACEQYSKLGQEYLQKTNERDAEAQKVESEWRSNISELTGNLRTLENERTGLQGKIDSTKRALETAQRQAALIDEVPCSGATAEGCKLLSEARQAKGTVESLTTEMKTLEGADSLAKLAIEGAGSALDQAEADMNAAIIETRNRLQAGIEEILKQKEALGYDRAAHQQMQADFNVAKQARDMLPKLSAAETRRAHADVALSDDRGALNLKRECYELVKAEALALAEQLPKTAEFNIGYQEAKVADIRTQIDRDTRALASAETLLEQVAAAERDFADLSKSQASAEHQRVIWATLQEAYSRDGIPALIIDAAIPQIEEYANDLLTRLSDGRMSLRFATQKRTGSGIAETLDIFVSDATGERAYEDFSGGEQLRVNLAVRIAIGQVLAQRSGATIRTLLLDEVCSPLDQAGEDALVESITRLQAMFDCILLVTHRDSLKDRLPQQIEVVKGSNGSEVRAA